MRRSRFVSGGSTLLAQSSTTSGVGEFATGAGLKAQQLALRAQCSLLSDQGRGDRQKSERPSSMPNGKVPTSGSKLIVSCSRWQRGRSALNREVRRLGVGGSVYFGAVAEPLVERLTDLDPDEFACVRLEMERRPERWLTPLRDALANGSESAAQAAQCLDVIGSAEDVPRLRRFGKRRPAERDLGRGLARRVAEHVFVEDQGRVAIEVGARRVEGTQIRRKVLTLLVLPDHAPALFRRPETRFSKPCGLTSSPPLPSTR